MLALGGHELAAAVDRAGAALAAQHRPRGRDEGEPAVTQHRIARVGRDVDAQTRGAGRRGDRLGDGVLELAEAAEAGRQRLRAVRQVERAAVVRQDDGRVAGDVDVRPRSPSGTSRSGPCAPSRG